MNKILNKIIYLLKNIMLPFTMVATIYIIINMFQRLNKDIFSSSLGEFIGIIIPFLILLILACINSVFRIKSVRDNILYNFVSFISVLTIAFFCYRALFDQNMIMWHKYGYNINFTYFADQVGAIKVLLYGLAIANILLMITDKLNSKDETKKKLNSE